MRYIAWRLRLTRSRLRPTTLSPAYAAKRVLEITFKWGSNYQIVSNKTLFPPQMKRLVGSSLDWVGLGQRSSECICEFQYGMGSYSQ